MNWRPTNSSDGIMRFDVKVVHRISFYNIMHYIAYECMDEMEIIVLTRQKILKGLRTHLEDGSLTSLSDAFWREDTEWAKGPAWEQVCALFPDLPVVAFEDFQV